MKKTLFGMAAIIFLVNSHIFAEEALEKNNNGSVLGIENLKNHYPIKHSVIDDLSYFGEDLLKYSNELAAKRQQTDDARIGKLKVIRIDILLLERDIRGVVTVLAVEYEHGQEKQFSVTALFAINRYIESIVKKLNIMLDFYNDIKSKEKDGKMIKEVEQCIAYHAKAKEFLAEIGKQLSQ